MRANQFLLSLGLLLVIASCDPLNDQSIPDQVMGMAPIYGIGQADSIVMEAPRPIESLGKMYYKDQIIFAAEQGQGIHIIDNSNPSQPDKTAFLRISGNTDIAIKGNILYANNKVDLVAVDISQLDSIRIISRVKNVFPSLDGTGLFPPNYFGYFECADPSKGIVVGWQEKMLNSPQCWR